MVHSRRYFFGACAMLLAGRLDPGWAQGPLQRRRRRFPGAAPPVDEEQAEQQYIERTNAALDKLMAWASQKPKHRLLFSANLFLAHGAIVTRFPQETLIAYADRLKETGLHRIDINPTPQPWVNRDQATIAKYDALIEHIRRSGLQLALNPAYVEGQLPVRSFEDWQNAASGFYTELARRYKPDVFVVAHEPTTMNRRMKIEASPQQWADFSRAMALAVKKQSGRSRCGAGGLASEMDYFKEFLRVRELDVMTLDIYFLGAIPTYNQMVALARKAGKPVYIEETWRTPFQGARRGRNFSMADYVPGRTIASEEFQALDSKWLRAMTMYASAMQMEAITPFWTQTFFKYSRSQTSSLSYEYNAEAAQAIRSGQRTPTWETFRELIREYGTS